MDKENNHSYYFLYFNIIDSISHQYGLSSAQTNNEILIFLSIVEKIFIPLFENNSQQVVFLMTADHGYMEVDPTHCFHINKKAREILKYLKINKKGQYLVPAALLRDMFLYVKEEHLEKTKKILEKKFTKRVRFF